MRFVHFDDRVYLKVIMCDGQMDLHDTEFISNDGDPDQFFPPSNTPDQNAELLLSSLDPFSIINCFNVFTEEAAAKVSEAAQSSDNGRTSESIMSNDEVHHETERLF
jgi:hypothetical protein